MKVADARHHDLNGFAPSPRYPAPLSITCALGSARMRLCAKGVVGLVFASALLAWPAPGQAYIEHPWCTGGGGWSGALTCGFVSYEQCRANARSCGANPSMTPYPQVAAREARTNTRR